MTCKLPLRWRSLGAAEGAAVGALAFLPVGGGFAAITLDVLVVHILSTSIATRAAHAYGFDPSSPHTERMIDRMVQRAYSEQAAKVATQRQAGSAFRAAAGQEHGLGVPDRLVRDVAQNVGVRAGASDHRDGGKGFGRPTDRHVPPSTGLLHELLDGREETVVLAQLLAPPLTTGTAAAARSLTGVLSDDLQPFARGRRRWHLSACLPLARGSLGGRARRHD